MDLLNGLTYPKNGPTLQPYQFMGFLSKAKRQNENTSSRIVQISEKSLSIRGRAIIWFTGTTGFGPGPGTDRKNNNMSIDLLLITIIIINITIDVFRSRSLDGLAGWPAPSNRSSLFICLHSSQHTVIDRRPSLHPHMRTSPAQLPQEDTVIIWWTVPRLGPWIAIIIMEINKIPFRAF